MKTLTLLLFALQLTNHSFAHEHPLTDSVKKSTVNLRDGLLAYYPFNGNANDASGHNNNGFILDGGTMTHDEHGNPASAFRGNGRGGRVIVGNNGTLAIDTAFTISFTVCQERHSRQDFISLVENSSGKAVTFAVGPSDPNSQSLIFGVVDQTGSCEDYNHPYNTHGLTSGFVTRLGAWYQITCTFNRGVSKLYINGKLNTLQTFPAMTTHVCQNAQLITGREVFYIKLS